MSAPPRTVLITGGNGILGGVLRQSLPELGWRVRTLDLEPPLDGSGDWLAMTVTDQEGMQRATEDVDAVVHLGGISAPGQEWEEYLNVNIHGTWCVLDAARRSRVRRVVLASSNHAAGYAPRGKGEAPADLAPRPDSFYGVSKAGVEALGSFFADEYGLEVTSLRIGSCLERPHSTRGLASWLSYPDFVRLTHAALDGPWNGHSTVWGISRNTRRWWSLEAGERIGYHPQDDAEIFADDVTGEDPPFLGGDAPPRMRS